jgi:hypothetical protein
VREIYQYLLKFEVSVKEEELGMLQGLDADFDDFNGFIYDSEKMLEKSKGTMKRELEIQMDAYSNQMTELLQTSKLELPYSNQMTPQEAMKVMTDSYSCTDVLLC